jgi:hypothetical protein
MSFTSNGVDPVHSLQKILTQLRLANLCVNGSWSANFASDEDINYNTSTSTPAALFPATPDAPPPQAPPPSGPITRTRARELNFVMLLKNEGPEE